MSHMRSKYRKALKLKTVPLKGYRVFCFDCSEKVTAVVFGHPVNHCWKRTKPGGGGSFHMSQVRGCAVRKAVDFHDIGINL